MKLLSKLRTLFAPKTQSAVVQEPEEAYDAWAGKYDQQPDNLILALDEELFAGLLKDKVLDGWVIADIGCGTGRHWKSILNKSPKRLLGFDVSHGMLDQLRLKYPAAETFLLAGNTLPQLPDGSCDLVISTLALAHMEELEPVLKEWCRILKTDGEILITDYHPIALQKGGSRTFRHQGQLISVRSYVHPIETIKSLAKQLGLDILRFSERQIDDSVKPFYEKQGALTVFEKFKGVPIIYSLHLKKTHVPAES